MFARLRSLLFIVWLFVTVVPYALTVVVVALFASSSTIYVLCAHWLKISILGARVICGVHWRLQGMDNVPTAADGNAGVILAPKHQSTWETFAFPMLMPHPVAYVFKKELLMIPFFGWAIGRMDMIHIDRSKRAEAWKKVAERGRELTARGIWVIMFPEGTRAERGSQGDYKSGATRLAIWAKVPVVPIAVTSARCWPRKSFVLRPGVIDVSIGKPIAPEGRRPDEMMKEVETWIEAEMRRLDPEAYAAVPADQTPADARAA
jgi:1-acyl-sn-glycerol-3-phosphate acyltransferase